ALGAVTGAYAQLLFFGAQCGINYSHYSLSEKNSMIEVEKGSIGFHSGFFARYDFENFYLGADLNYSSTIGGTVNDTETGFNVRSGSVNLAGMIGKKFYPGIRLYVGGIPTVYIKHNENEFESFLSKSPQYDPLSDGSIARNEFIFFITFGVDVELSKFFVGMRYEHPLDFFIKEDYSTGGINSGIDNVHYVSQVVFTVGYRFN
ncbi:MAG TPA: outer membrane beta-barrel protein, partial [Bacteroidales bacterium]|nr:outer membrane beta-barrel protein [Bacteroidales bacterium]